MLTTKRRTPLRTLARTNPQYLIRLSLPKADWDDAWEVCRGIEQCGGHRSCVGFAFCSAAERAEALEILRERFGGRYFEPLDVRSEAEAVRVLVAVPYEGRRDRYCDYLARNGFRVSDAENGLECLRALQQQPPDILVLHRDLLWGGGDGVLNVMQQDSGLSLIPVVLLNSRHQTGEPPACRTASVITCLKEPVPSPVLLGTIQQLVHWTG